MRRREQADRPSQRIGDIGVVQICQQDDEGSSFQHATDADSGRHRIGLRRLYTQPFERLPDASHSGQTPGGRARYQGSIRKHHEPHTVVIWGGDFRKARRHIGIQAKPVEKTRSHATETPGIDDNEDIEMLILTEFPCHQPPRTRRRLPVDARQRVAVTIATQLMQFRAGPRNTP